MKSLALAWGTLPAAACNGSSKRERQALVSMDSGMHRTSEDSLVEPRGLFEAMQQQ
jgi:hypothetical protein